jgi:hypothetical protein
VFGFVWLKNRLYGGCLMRQIMMYIAAMWVSGVIITSAGWSQTAPATNSQDVVAAADLLTSKDLETLGAAQLAKAKESPSGSAGVTLSKYPGHYTMITARSKSGGAEVHQHFSDFLIVVDGQGTELTGGTVVEPKESADGEIRGLRLDGATPHPLHKGDVIHILAGTPHQAIEAPGQTLTLFVVKVATPTAEVAATTK